MSGCKCLERGVCFDGAAMRRLFFGLLILSTEILVALESPAKVSTRAGKRIEFDFQLLEFEPMRAIVVE